MCHFSLGLFTYILELKMYPLSSNFYPNIVSSKKKKPFCLMREMLFKYGYINSMLNVEPLVVFLFILLVLLG